MSSIEKDLFFPEMIPSDVQNTLRWLLRVEEFPTVKALAESIYKYLPQQTPDSSDFMAMVLNKAKFYRDAVPYAEKTVQMLPTPEAKFNLAKCLNSAGDPARAEKVMAEVVQEKPNWLDPKIDLAVYVSFQGRVDEAEKSLRRLLPEVAPTDRNHAVLKFNLGWHEIRLGNFKTGMAWLGIGRDLRIWGAYSFPFKQPALREGMDVKGKTILLVGEGGAGDEIINVRFAQTLRDRGAKVMARTGHGLQALMSRVPGVSAVFGSDQLINAPFDYWAPMMDLPRILELDAAEIPKQPYLSANPEMVKKWDALVPASKKLKIGIRWQGNSLYEQDLMRSVPFSLMETFLNIPNVEVYSLQRDAGTEERPKDSKVVDLSPHLKSWEDTAAAIEHLDLVISSCTSVPHLAAAMGKPVWLFCPMNCYYVWAGPQQGREWYPQIELHRQTKYGSWKEPYEVIYNQLKQKAESSY